MEYNENIYLTILHTDCDALGLEGNHRTSNDGTICILEYPTMDAIPAEVANLMIATYTHQEALALVEQTEWISELPL